MPFKANVLWWFLFHCHTVSIGSVFGVSFALRFSNHRLLYFFIYVVASNATFLVEKLFHGSYFLCMFLPPVLATLLQTLCCKIFMLKYFRRTSTLRKFFSMKIFPTKISYNENFPIYGIFQFSCRFVLWYYVCTSWIALYFVCVVTCICFHLAQPHYY